MTGGQLLLECLRDRAITVPMQRRMHGARPCAQMLAIDTDHSPFFSAQRELADHLLALA